MPCDTKRVNEHLDVDDIRKWGTFSHTTLEDNLSIIRGLDREGDCNSRWSRESDVYAAMSVITEVSVGVWLSVVNLREEWTRRFRGRSIRIAPRVQRRMNVVSTAPD